MIGDPVFWRNVSEYYSFAFEIGFVGIAYFLFRNQITLWKVPSRADVLTSIASFLVGLFVFKAAPLVQVPIPFDLSSGETVLLLIFFGPLLEEAIFRLALWQAFQTLLKNGWLTIVATTLLFAAGHFAAYWFVPEQFHGFVIYQTLYVLILGVLAGWRRLKSNAFAPAVLVHFGFNLGFFCAYKIFS